jgi:glycosyltransferase involved in cell wall biosynthesis
VYPSLHILGSRQFGGADQFYVRLVRALHEAGQPVTAVNRAGSPVAKTLAGVGIEQIHLPLANQWDVWSLLKIRQLVAAREPCIVQTYMGRATRLTRLPAKTRAVHIARLGGFYKIDGYYRHAHAWIGNTRAICDYLVRSGLPAARVYHIGNFVPKPLAVSEEHLAGLRRLHDIPAEARVLFALGRLIGKKGFDDLLRALARLPREVAGRPVLLLVAGDGPEAEALRALARELGQDDRVRWLGWQNPPDAGYALADVFVCPSRHEPLGNVILEAWNHRLPVVSTRTDGAVELIEDGRTGLLCACGDEQGMAGQIENLLEATDDQRRSLGEAGHSHLMSRYSRDVILAAYFALYDSLMAERGG